METFSARETIIETVTKLFVYTDRQQWDKLLNEVFANTVIFDMSSLGGEKMETTPKHICSMWEAGFKGIDSVNHLAGNYLVTITGDKADVFAYATATHYKAAAVNGKTREFVGTYDIGLQNSNGQWKINKFKYDLKYLSGNIDLI